MPGGMTAVRTDENNCQRVLNIFPSDYPPSEAELRSHRASGSRSTATPRCSGSPTGLSARLASRFAALKREGRAALVAYVMASDPDHETCFEILRGLPGAGADVIELGFPFTDPMADGPSIQKAALRALKAGGSLKQTLELARRFRETDKDTPLILMGYANPIEQHGLRRVRASDARRPAPTARSLSICRRRKMRRCAPRSRRTTSPSSASPRRRRTITG